ncbi:hypothetical protein TWF788_009806 [Orbilia oligospora]|uniref:F-box domain-containing protein n=1 Tax=Orbilia oligospora TaxID=2813651 RepID=A0A7C8Q2P6_ORBOL|nr:hypothetical protein TWF788_009806 [Orbilia oligospora]
MSQSCGLLDLPTELFLKILKELESPSQTSLSACSKSFYSAIFRFCDINTIRIDVYNLERISTILRIFKENDFFAQFIKFYTHITFNLPTAEDLSPFIPSLSNFSSVTTITIKIRRCLDLERNIYVKALSSLSTLTYYNNIQNLKFCWQYLRTNLYGERYDSRYKDNVDYMSRRTKMLRGYQGGDGYIERDMIYGDFDIIREAGFDLTEQEIRQRDGFRRNTEQERGTSYSALGRYWISNDILTKVSLNKKLLLPKGLIHLDLMIPSYEYSFCFPLLHCPKIMALELRFSDTSRISYTNILGPTNDFPRIYNNPVLYQSVHPTIKALKLSSPKSDNEYLEFLPQLQIHFPNLISLIIEGQYSMYTGRDIWPSALPNLPKLKCLALPLDFEECVDKVHQMMIEKLTGGYFRELRMLRLTFSKRNVQGFIITRVGDGSGEQVSDWELERIDDTKGILDNNSKDFSYLKDHGTAWWDLEDLEELKNNATASEYFGAGGDECTSTEYEEGSEYDSERERLDIEAAVKFKKREGKELWENF